MNEKILKKIMAEKGFDEKALAKAVRLSVKALSKRMSGEEEFNLAEIIHISKALSLTNSEIEEIFFT